MSDWTTLAQRYLDVWNEADEGKRRALADEVFTQDCGFTDPMADVSGPAQIEAVIAQVRAQFAGHVLRLVGSADGHHDQGRFTWELVPEDAGPDVDSLVQGFDVVLVGAEGKVQRVLGFLDKVPAA